MAASSRPLLLSRHRDLSLPIPLSRHLLLLRRRPRDARLSSAAVTACLFSGVDGGGGGLADDFVSTRLSGANVRREFSALASILRRIEPLDTSVVGKGVSAAARDSMTRTISTMLGLLPSDQFQVSVRVSSLPLHRLLVSSIVTGYTLWNAEYRLSLMRNFQSAPGSEGVAVVPSGGIEVLGEETKESEDGDEVPGVDCSAETVASGRLGDLSPDALSYIQELESQLAIAEEELHDQKQEYILMESSKEDDNDLLKYLRSLEPDMVSELSRPSSLEVEEIIQQLVHNAHAKIFEDEGSSFLFDSDKGITGDQENQDAIATTRDYLAKLLFWILKLIAAIYIDILPPVSSCISFQVPALLKFSSRYLVGAT